MTGGTPTHLLLAAGLLAAKRDAVVGLEPLAEGGGIDLDDTALHNGLGSDQLVVAGVVDDVDHTRLAREALRRPREGAGLEAERAVLEVTATHAHGVDALRAQLGHRRLATQLVLPLLHDLRALATSGAPLVAAITGDT